MPKHSLLGTQYLHHRKKRFLEDTRCRTPVEAVMAVKRTLEQWSDILNEEREFELEHLNTRSLARLEISKTAKLVPSRLP